MNEILEKVRRELKEASDEKTRQAGLRYFREDVNLYGIRSKTVSEIAKANYALIRTAGKDVILALCDSLWQSGMMEESFVACVWSEKQTALFTPDDFPVLEKWVHFYVSNWASCDTLCNHTVGDFIQKYPEYIAELKKWARSENRWVKRSSRNFPFRAGMISDTAEALFTHLFSDLAHFLSSAIYSGYFCMKSPTV